MLKFIAIITGVFIVGALIFITYSVTKDVKPRLKTMYVEQIGRFDIPKTCKVWHDKQLNVYYVVYYHNTDSFYVSYGYEDWLNYDTCRSLAQQFRYEQDAVFLSQITDKQMQSAIEMYKNLSEARSKRSYAEMKAVLDKYK